MNPSRLVSILLVVGVLAVLAVGLSHQSYQATSHNDVLKAWFLDVGQGDAMLLETPQRHTILIDGGPDATVLTHLSQYLPIGNKEITIVISTHNDADHLSGLVSVLQSYQVDEVVDTGATYTSATYKHFTEELTAKKTPVKTVQAGDTLTVDGLSGIIISPATSLAGTQLVSNNAASVVVYWQYGQETLLTEGDAQSEQEQAMLTHQLVRHADILKVAHHGSATSSSEAFLKAVAPNIAIISVGKNNSYHLPNSGILDRYAYLHIPLLRTDQNGTIVCDISLSSYHCAGER